MMKKWHVPVGKDDDGDDDGDDDDDILDGITGREMKKWVKFWCFKGFYIFSYFE